MITKIVYPVPNETLGNTNDSDCENYREWFTSRLKAQYPDVDVTVTDKPGLIHIETDDESDDSDLIASAHDFGNFCWDNCPWGKL